MICGYFDVLGQFLGFGRENGSPHFASKGSKLLKCNSLDSTLRTALASFYGSDTDWYSILGILSEIAMFQQPFDCARIS
jgi:hypothetical protein